MNSVLFLEMPPANHIPSVYPAPEIYTTIRQHVNNNPLDKEYVQHQERGIEGIFLECDNLKQSETFKTMI